MCSGAISSRLSEYSKMKKLPLRRTSRSTEEIIRSVVLFSFFFLVDFFLSLSPLFVVNIVVVVIIRLRVPMAKSCRLCCVSASVVEKRKGLFEHLKRKKTTSSAWRSSRKKLRHSGTEEKNALPRSAAAVFLYRVFFFILSFSFFPLCFASSTTTTLLMWWCSRAFVTLALLRC